MCMQIYIYIYYIQYTHVFLAVQQIWMWMVTYNNGFHVSFRGCNPVSQTLKQPSSFWIDGDSELNICKKYKKAFPSVQPSTSA